MENRRKKLLFFAMRLIVLQLVLTVLFCGTSFANYSFGQNALDKRINITVRNQPMKSVLKEIEKDAGVEFTYISSILPTHSTISITEKNQKLKDVLSRLLKPYSLDYSILGNQIIIKRANIVFKIKEFIIVTGIITDIDNTPIVGASIIVKGGTAGTTTGENGAYSISVDENAVLEISAVGYLSQTINVNKRTNIDIVLQKEDNKLDEVVVIGYGSQKRKDITTAVSTVDNKQIMRSKSFSVSNALAGQVPGLIVNQRSSRPGNDAASVYIRGISTTGNSSALIVVDGVANRDGISRIDPNDIETISVLKDASAAVYGAQSANGVILITTKRGKTGKPIINYSYNHGIVSPTRYMKMSKASDFVKGINDLDRQAGRNPTYTPQQVADYETGALPNTDWLRETQKSNFSQGRHNLSVSGGNESVKYFLSLGTGTQGTITRGDKTSSYTQHNFRSNVDAQVSKSFSVGLDLAGRKEIVSFLGVSDGDLFSWSVLGPPVLPATILGGYPASGRGNNNPLAVVSGDSYNRTENFLLNGTLKAKYKIPGVEGLYLDGFFALDQGQNFQKVWQQPWTFYVDDNGVASPRTRPVPTSLSENINKSQSITKNIKLNYVRDFDEHAISAFVSFEQNQFDNQNVSASRSGFVSPVIDQLFAGSPIKENQSNDGNAADGARQNYLGRISYGYAKKYLAQLYIGVNGSQIFPIDKRFGYFPGGSLGWVISEEQFMKNVSLVNSLKLRASYGVLGNDRVGQYQYLNVYNFGAGYVFNGVDVASLNPGVAANPNITWEKKKSLDIGLDATVLNNSLSLTLDYFRSRTSDILARRNATIPNYTGLVLPNENIGIVDNAGIDVEVNYNRTVRKIRFNVGGNFTFVKNKVVFIDEVTPAVPYQNVTGRPIGTQFLYKVIGVYRTAEDLSKYPGLAGKRVGDFIYKDVNGDGIINGDDRYPVERNATPQIQYGLNLGLLYNQIDFSAQFHGQARAVQYFTYLFDNSNNVPEYYVKNAWRPDNTGAQLPSIGRSKGDNDFFLRDVSFLRLKNVELGYTFSKDILSKLRFQSTRIYVNGYNLLTFDKLKKDGLGDPENVNSAGFVFPQTKILSFGINISF